MGKRSNFTRKPRDLYPTPPPAVAPLLPHVTDIRFFHEPCAGDGDLVRHLEAAGKVCSAASDIAEGVDALSITECRGDAFITNPPWLREILHRLIAHLSAIAPTWLLLDADWAHTDQAIPFLRWCRKIVSVGRVKWDPDSPHTGKDNAAWYFFDQSDPGPIEFVGPIS
jgi:hypothetical protein